MKLGDFFVRIGVQADTFTVRDFSRAIADIPVSVAGALVSLAGISYGFTELTKDVLNMNAGLQVFTASTGQNTVALQQWEQVAKQAGLSGDVAAGAFNRLASVMGALRTGHPDRAFMQAMGQLGVAPGLLRGSIPDLMNAIQAAALRKNPISATALLSQMGFAGPEMMRLFQTPAGDRMRIPIALNEGTSAQMAEFQKSLADLQQGVLVQFVQVLKEIEPLMKDLTVALVDIIKVLGPLVVGGLRAGAEVGRDLHNKRWLDALSFFPQHTVMGLAANYIVNNNSNVTVHSTGGGPEIGGEIAEQMNRRAAAHHRKAAANLRSGR